MIEINTLAWEKVNDLMPVVVQDADTLQVLMLGYMNREALQQTITKQRVIFFSRSKQRLWMKGETTGNYLLVNKIIPDCDQDALLIFAKPVGPTCHFNNTSCFGEEEAPGLGFLSTLIKLIEQRYQHQVDGSYTAKLFQRGTQRIAQKVGEEGVEVALAAVTNNQEELRKEVADLIYHLLVLLRQCNLDITQVIAELRQRYANRIDATKTA